MDIDVAALVGQPAGCVDVQELLSAIGPWQVNAYPSVGKVGCWVGRLVLLEGVGCVEYAVAYCSST